MKNKTFRTVIISLIIFTLVAVGVTYSMIRFTIKNKTEQLIVSGDSEVIEKIPEEDEPKYINLGIDPNGTFNQNSINWIEQAYQENEISIEYYKISGLKDKNIENKINEKLKAAAFKYFDSEKVDTIKINAYQSINANFGNVICVYNSVSMNTIGNSSNYTYESGYINLDLVTGNEIEFKDIFVDENAMLQCMTTELYENEAWNKQWEKETDLWDGGYEYNEELWNAPVLDVDEDAVIQKLYEWKNAKIEDFYFSSSYACAEAYNKSGDSMWMYIVYKNMPSAIAIYSRFLTDESIYEDDSVGLKNIINMSSETHWLYADYKEYKNDKNSNLFANTRINFEWYEIDYEKISKIEEMVINIAKQEMIEIERQAMAEPDKYHALSSSYSISKGAREYFYINKNKSYYYTDINLKNEMYDKIKESYVYFGGEEYGVYDLYIDLEYTEENKFISGDRNFEESLYSMKTFEKLENVEDFFMDGVDYKTLMKNELNKLWYGTYGVYLDEERLEEEYNNTEFEYDTDWSYRNGTRSCFEVYNKWLGFKPYSDDYRETGYKIYFDVFNPDDLTI